MAGIRFIRRRIRSVKNIAQITRAMEMVAASKMKKAINTAISGKPYADKIYQVVSELTKIVDTNYHRLLSRENPKASKSLVILISTNKGLCGSLNTNLFRKSLSWFPEKQNHDFITLGAKGARFVVAAGYTLKADFSHLLPFTKHTGAVIELVVQNFLQGFYKQVVVVYNEFINALTIQAQKKILLPMSQIVADETTKLPPEFLIEPNPQQLLNALLPHYLETQVRSAIIEAEASEHSARMVAMKAATDNALSLASELTLIYNKLRQEQITYEIADITRAQISLIQ